MRRTIALVLSAILVVAFAAPALADSDPQGPKIAFDAIYADGELYGTIGLTPLPYNGNDHSFDTIYLVPGQQAVAEAAPGPGFNGGRWLPTEVTWNVTPYLLTSSEDVMAAHQAGDINVGTPDYDGAFLCPLIRNR
jgi:hypothetical protein